jgi:hypothetical protein
MCSGQRLRSAADLKLIKFSYVDFGDTLRDDGEIVMMDAAAPHVLRIFTTLRNIRFPIAKATLMNRYEGNDDASMEETTRRLSMIAMWQAARPFRCMRTVWRSTSTQYRIPMWSAQEAPSPSNLRRVPSMPIVETIALGRTFVVEWPNQSLMFSLTMAF